MKDRLVNGEAFITDPADNSMSVRQDYADPVVLSNIGKNNNWIQLKLEVFKTGENGVYTYTPGVSFQLSTSNGYVSILSEEEFLTLYTIIKDLNLASIQCQISLAFLNTDNGGVINYGYDNGYSQPQAYYPPQQMQYQPSYPQGTPMMQYPQNNRQPNYPRYQNNGYQPKQSFRAPAAPAPMAPAVPQTRTPAAPEQTYAEPQQTQNLPPRGNKPLMTMKAIEDTPIDPYDVDDEKALGDALNQIFNNNN
jgi:hypothetical protein